MESEFEKTYRNFYPKLFRIATKLLQDSEGAKDVVQDVFTAYYHALQGKKSINEVEKWLVRSTINKGVQDNILYFLNPSESGKNQCRAYSVSEGKTVEQCTFTSDEYDLAITKNRFVFYNDYLYGIQELKDYDGMLLRLVRFELK